MKKFLFLAMMVLALASCQKQGSDTWESVKTAGRYVNRGIDSLFGKDYDTLLVASDDEFVGPIEGDFIPLNDDDLATQFQTTDRAIGQPKESSTKGGVGRFIKPPARLGTVFRTIKFSTDDHVVREREDLVTIARIANYLKKHPKMRVSVEGHCDERASAAYNLALGTRRANHVRVLLIKQGLDFNRLYTISHGKEHPLSLGHGAEDWKKNRRVEFKIIEKR